ncbi:MULTISPECIES: hypothetical protein [unclassified Streptomyces]|uniref:hypothetical protein n=1 Tax=unclassified Streptomyces TaxID=2593676 RepID=UPI00332D6331
MPRAWRGPLLDQDVDPRNHVDDAMNSGPRLATAPRMGSDLGAAESVGQFLELCGRAPTARRAFSAGSAEANRATMTRLTRRLQQRPVGAWTYDTRVGKLCGQLSFVHTGWTHAAEMPKALLRVRTPQEFPAPPPRAYRETEQEAATVCSESPNPRVRSGCAGLDAFSASRAKDIGRGPGWDDEGCAQWFAAAADRRTDTFSRPTAPDVPPFAAAKPAGGIAKTRAR